MRHVSRALLLVLAAGVGFAQRAAPADPVRRALVIANSKYRHLPSPADASGANAIMAALKEGDLKFTEVVLLSDVKGEDFEKWIKEGFLDHLKAGDQCFIYYSGYAVASRSLTFLVPVDFNPDGSPKIHESGYALAALAEQLDEKKLGFYVVALEANWENEKLGVAALTFPAKRSPNALIAFANSSNSNKALHNGQVAPFTRALAAEVRSEGPIATVFDKIRKNVVEASKGDQTPDSQLGLAMGDACFRCPTVGPTAAELAAAREAAQREKRAADLAKEKLEAAKREVEAAAERAKNEIHGQTRINLKDREEYVGIRAGRFLMGCIPDSGCLPGETKQHEAEVTQQFWMARNEVVVSKYQQYVAKGNLKMPPAPSLGNPRWQKENHPIVNITWEEADAYCKWVGGRLPTETEWEYAARAGKNGDIYPFQDLETSRETANFDGKKGNDTFVFTAPVRSFDPNGFGLFDIFGNVWEWVTDPDPVGKVEKGHVARGGSFASDPKKHLRISFRAFYEKKDTNIGFRCVLPDSEKVRANFSK